MDFSAFDTSKIEEYARRAKEQWGNTAEYKESEEKAKGRTKEEEKDVMVQFMQIFAEFGAIKDQAPDGAEAQSKVKKLQDYITEHFYVHHSLSFDSLEFPMYDPVRSGTDVRCGWRIQGKH